MTNLSIKDVPEDWAEALRRQAARNHRSLQGELMAMLEREVRRAEEPHVRRRGTKTIEEIAQERRRRYPEPLSQYPTGTEIIRQERDSR